MSAKLEKCVCGAETPPTFDQRFARPDTWHMRCPQCGRTGPWCLSLDDAETAWNKETRALRSHDGLVDVLKRVNEIAAANAGPGHAEIHDITHAALASAEEPEEVTSAKPTTTREMVEAYLKKHGYDGLYAEGECACLLDDLCPCGDIQSACLGGYKNTCPGTCGEHDFHVGPDRL